MQSTLNELVGKCVLGCVSMPYLKGGQPNKKLKQSLKPSLHLSHLLSTPSKTNNVFSFAAFLFWVLYQLECGQSHASDIFLPVPRYVV